MPSFEILADIFTRLSVFDSPKGSSNTFKTRKNISLYFKRRHLIIYNSSTKILAVLSVCFVHSIAVQIDSVLQLGNLLTFITLSNKSFKSLTYVGKLSFLESILFQRFDIYF